MEFKQLNPFEIKAELQALFEKLKGVTDFETYQLNFKMFDNQDDKTILIRLLLKELSNVKDNAPLIKYLLIRYCEKDLLSNNLWTLIKNQMTPNLTKIIALDILRDITTDWSYEDCENYLENPNDLVDEDTKRLLTAAILNPEVQIDFLDFLNSLGENDKLTLVSSLAEDYEKDELANVLIPVFLSQPDSEVGKKSLELLGNSRSVLAFHALNISKDYVSDSILFNLKKSLSALKLAGIREDNSHEFYLKLLSESKLYKSYSTYPDGQGNMALIFSRMKKGGKIQFVAVVINDEYGIKDCFGFNEISKFECDTIIDRFYKEEKAVAVSPIVMKKILHYAEVISKKSGKWKIPYEYVCWKNLLNDIEIDEISIKEGLTSQLKVKELKQRDFDEILALEFFDYWFLDSNYSDEFVMFLNTLDTKLASDVNFDIDLYIDEELDNVFYQDEKDVWYNRLLICAYLLFEENQNELAQKVLNLYFDEENKINMLKYILRKSIYEYYVSINRDDQGVFAKNVIEDIVKNIEKKWVEIDV